MFPVQPTKFDNNYKEEWFEKDYIFSPDGIKEWPNHHCKNTWLKSLPFIKQKRNAVDIGCRDGEYTRYLSNTFEHTYCFDDRVRKYFSYNCDQTKVTHFACLVGNEKKSPRYRDFDNHLKEKVGKFYKLDDFKLKDVDYIKIDTDGYEMPVILGAMKTIKKYNPIIILEVFYEKDTLKFCTDKLGYTIADVCDRGWDHVLIRQ